MTLTPVRVRGKKRNRELVNRTLSQVSRAQLLSKRPRTVSKTARSKSRKETIAAMPTLQGLPQELLEIVFLYSMNISLPRASHDLGRKLSSRTVCLEFCVRAFFDTVEHKAPIRTRKITSDPIFQSEILTCKFYNWAFFLAYVQKAYDAYRALRGRIWAGVTVPDVTCFDGLWPFRFAKITYLSFAEDFQIPEKLLHGPWTQDKASLLYVLVSLNGEIDWEGSMAGETAKEGLKEAISEGNEHAVAALSVLLGVARAITTDMLRYAVIDGGCDMNIIRHLLFNVQILYRDTSRDTLNLYDPILWQWADNEGEDDGKGELLKDMIKRAEKFDLEFYKEGESDFKSIVPFPYSGEKFGAQNAFDNIVRELLTLLYRNHGRRIPSARHRRSQYTTEEHIQV